MIDAKELLEIEMNKPAATNIVGCIWSSFDAFELLEKYDLIAYNNNDIMNYKNAVKNLLKDKRYIDDVAAFVIAYLKQYVIISDCDIYDKVKSLLNDEVIADSIADNVDVVAIMPGANDD